MTDPDNPIDYARTTQHRAGMVMKDRRQVPGAALLVLAMVCLVGFMTSFAMGSTGWTVGLGVAALVAGGAGAAWILLGRRRAARLGDDRARR